MSAVFHPAIAIYSIALAASVAVYFVLAPISLAFLDKLSKFVPVAPEMAATEDIAFSKLIPALTALVVTLLSAIPTAVTALPPIAAIAPNPSPLDMVPRSRSAVSLHDFIVEEKLLSTADKTAFTL